MTDEMLCVIPNSQDSCVTDLGGPLVVRSPDGSYSLAGVFSAAMRCTSDHNFGFFISVAAVRDWLADYMVL